MVVSAFVVYNKKKYLLKGFTMTLNEANYHQLIDNLQQTIEDQLDALDLDIDINSANGILTIIFDNTSQIILSRQSALLQLWVAAKSGGYHLVYNTEQNDWFVTNSGESLKDLLKRLINEQTGYDLDIL